MTEVIRIDSQRAFSRFLDAVDSFHDALLHEAVILHPGHVERDGTTFGDAQMPNARLIFQSPFQDIAGVQLDLRSVFMLKINFKRDFDWKAEFKPGIVRFYLDDGAGSLYSEICAAEIGYMLLGKDALGATYRMVKDELLLEEPFFNED